MYTTRQMDPVNLLTENTGLSSLTSLRKKCSPLLSDYSRPSPAGLTPNLSPNNYPITLPFRSLTRRLSTGLVGERSPLAAFHASL
jgi:hypothetical protein